MGRLLGVCLLWAENHPLGFSNKKLLGDLWESRFRGFVDAELEWGGMTGTWR